MSTNWTATVQRINPATDVLVVKVQHRIDQQQAHDIRQQVRAILPDIKVLVLDQGIETVVIKKLRAKTLVRAAKVRR
jgi:hypothetical protein